MTMTHPGLSLTWALLVGVATLMIAGWSLVKPTPKARPGRHFNLSRFPLVGTLIVRLTTSRALLLGLKLLMVAFFITVIVAGLFGTPIAERNFATLITWNFWWAGLVFSIFFFGTAWCAVCPWDALAQWLVRRRWIKRAQPNNSLNLPLPHYLNNIWPALALFIGLTWLELGVGITTNPRATALVALLMVLLATISLALFKRKAFCRHFCPVGRTVGAYSQLAAVELRPVEPDICASCETLACYHGNDDIDPCPTFLVMGKLTQNSYCTACGNCTQSCQDDNVAWRLRTPSSEAAQGSRPHWDEAWFMIGLLALTAFHGLTMMPFWESWMSRLARMTGDSGQLLGSFTLGMTLTMAVIASGYLVAVAATRHLTRTPLDFKKSFSALAFVTLPLAFTYHLAHNLNHLVRESSGWLTVIANPLGINTLPLSMAEKHLRHSHAWLSVYALQFLQAGLLITGFWLAMTIIRHRHQTLLAPDQSQTANSTRQQLIPMAGFAVIITGFHLWMLMQPMLMRM